MHALKKATRYTNSTNPNALSTPTTAIENERSKKKNFNANEFLNFTNTSTKTISANITEEKYKLVIIAII